jgi:glycine betaine/choline ABC-type transport system substrate-binding protein
LAVRKDATHKLDGERFNLSKLNDVEVRNPYQIEITNRFAVLEKLSDIEDLNRAWENTI